MEPAFIDAGQPGETSKRFARWQLAIGDNRLELLMVEVQEERERLLHPSLLVLVLVPRSWLAFRACR